MKRAIIISLFSLVILVGAGLLLTNHLIDKRIASEIDAELEKVSGFISVDYGKVHHSLFSGRTAMSDVVIAGAKDDFRITVDRIQLLQFDENFPYSAHLSLEGIRSPSMMEDDDFRQYLERMGYTTLTLDLELDYHYDTTTGHLVMEDLLLSSGKMGELRSFIDLSNLHIPPDGRINILQQLSLTLNALEITYIDNGLANEMIEEAARGANMTPEQWINAVTANLHDELRSRVNPGNEKRVDAISGFLENPDRITVIARPDPPANLGAIMLTLGIGGKSRLPDILDLQISN